MISKELLSEVLGYKCNPQFTKVALARGEFAYYANSDNTMTKANFINIYELAHKCKEWAMGQEVQVNSNNSNQCIIFGIGYSFKESFSAETEPEAIFKACQWILDNEK